MKLLRSGVAVMVLPWLLLQGVGAASSACKPACCACTHHGAKCCASHAPRDGKSAPASQAPAAMACCAPAAMATLPFFVLAAPATMADRLAPEPVAGSALYSRIPFKV